MSLYSYGFKTLLSSLALANALESKMRREDSIIQEPVDTVSIIIPTYNEEEYIEECLKSLKNQSIIYSYPDYFEYILVDSNSKDKTLELATPYVNKIIKVGRGKLTARNLATLESKGNIIVSVDADCVYPFHWLNTLLKPFNNPNVVASVGSTYDNTVTNLPSQVYMIASSISRYILNPTQMVGRNSAYYKHLFYITGMFDTTINQQNVNEMLKEEEIGFGKKLSNYGLVVYKHNAYTNHLGGQKMACRIGLDSKMNCNKYKIGIERFG